MAIGRGVSLLRFAKGAVDRQNEINADKQKESDKHRQTQLAFASASYKADLDRYSRFMKMKDSLTMQGREGAAAQIASNYGYKAGKGKEEFMASVNKKLADDPEYMQKLIGNYDKIAKPKPADYFRDNEWNKLSKARINAEDGITRLLFGGGKHPNMLTMPQIEAREAELRAQTGGRDFTKGFAEEMLRMKPLDVEAPEIGTKLSQPVVLENKEGEQKLAATVEEYRELIEVEGYFKPKKALKPLTGAFEVFHNPSTMEEITIRQADPRADTLVAEGWEKGRVPKEAKPYKVVDLRTSEKIKAGRFLEQATNLDEFTSFASKWDEADTKDERPVIKDAIFSEIGRLRATPEGRDASLEELTYDAIENVDKRIEVKEGSFLGIFPTETITVQPPGKEVTQLPSILELPSPQTQEEFEKIPSGTIYIDPDDGKRYRKP
jgi:hypothetical protein